MGVRPLPCVKVPRIHLVEEDGAGGAETTPGQYASTSPRVEVCLLVISLKLIVRSRQVGYLLMREENLGRMVPNYVAGGPSDDLLPRFYLVYCKT
jgi:hypothetical protein